MKVRQFALLFTLLLVLHFCDNPPTEVDTKATDDDEILRMHGIPVDKYPAFVTQPWFPLEDNAKYLFEGRFEEKIYRKTVTVIAHQTAYGVLYYFAEPDEIGYPSPIVSANMYGLAGYISTANKVLTIQADYFDGFSDERAAYVQTLLRLPPRLGHVTEIKDGRTTITLKLDARENIIVPAGEFKSCFRIRIVHKFPDGEESSTIWIAKGIGLVKWIRATGRVDELVEYKPSTQTVDKRAIEQKQN